MVRAFAGDSTMTSLRGADMGTCFREPCTELLLGAAGCCGVMPGAAGSTVTTTGPS
ncbi:hypothetical protein GALL_371740 [mine drainage metagenome]|uniref:Uncharacterized protein n=1 Tax=mine drainage metagenome TaxID=410659 RepID=A0A1J5QUA4_9ZZZZ